MEAIKTNVNDSEMLSWLKEKRNLSESTIQALKEISIKENKTLEQIVREIVTIK